MLPEKSEEVRLEPGQSRSWRSLQKERAEKLEIATNLRVELRHNQEFAALEEAEKRAGTAAGKA